MRLSPYSLRVAVPILLLVGCTLIGAVTVMFELHQSDRRAEQRSLEYLSVLGRLVAGDITAALRSGTLSQVRSEIGRAMTDRQMRLAVLFDDTDKAIMASDYVLIDKPLQQTPLAGLTRQIAAARQGQAVLEFPSDTQQSLVGLFPVTLAPRPGELLSGRVGVLALINDVSNSYTQARADALIRSGFMLAMLAGYCLLVLIIAHNYITRRVDSLVAATRSIAAGDFESRVTVIGADEISQVGRAINEMAQQLGRDALALRTSEDNLRNLNEALEERVRIRTLELASSNRELEAFAYTVAHDLRSPLRAIMGHVEILMEDHLSKVDGEMAESLSRIHHNAQRMSQLINDLLKLSKIGKQALATSEAHPSAIMRELADEISSEANDRLIEWQIDETPACDVDRTLFKQLLSNLAGNAVKYTAGRQPASIHFGSIRNDGKTIYFIRDNGVGFDMQYAENIFDVFRRLHDEKQFAGTGVGLAIVQRIIQRHHGSVWTESSPGQGATFYFTIGTKHHQTP